MRRLARWDALAVTTAVAMSTVGCAPRANLGTEDATVTEVRSKSRDPFHKEGFVTSLDDGRLWIFHANSEELEDFESTGHLEKHVTYIGAGPGGRTVKGPGRDVVLDYLARKPGFVTVLDDGRIWVFREGSEELEAYRDGGAPEKHVTRIGAGPLGATLKAPDTSTLDEYAAWKPGFTVRVADGRLWVFRRGSAAVEELDGGAAPEKHVTRVGAGPDRMTVKALDRETIDAYQVAQVGFRTLIDSDGRLWVFREGSEDLETFEALGHPEKHITLVAAGPMRLTVKAPDRETAEAYLIRLK